jgi:hypothetical protein
VATSEVALSILASDPWGCVLKTDEPDASKSYPKYILAEARTECLSYVPSGSRRIEHQQHLYRSSWIGWRLVGSNDSFCDSKEHSSGQPAPNCYSYVSPRMRAWVWWNCVDAGFRGGWYNYRQVDYSYIRYGGVTYSAQSAIETGPWYQDGNVLCGQYL